MDTKRLGKVGEDLAVEYLEKNGFKILERNFVFRIPGAPQKAEIDIIAKKDDVISFVEVKTSFAAEQSYWQPEERVNFQKQRKIMQAAEVWLSKHNMSFETPAQIDIIAILMDGDGGGPTIRYFPNVG